MRHLDRTGTASQLLPERKGDTVPVNLGRQIQESEKEIGESDL